MLKGSRNSLGGVLLFVFGLLTAAIVLFRVLRGLKNPEESIRDVFGSSNYKAGNVDLWVAVSKLESDNYNSELCTKYKNLFGMTLPTTRITTASSAVSLSDAGTNNLFCVYSSYTKSAQDLLLWLQYVQFPSEQLTIEQFVNAMKQRGYFTAGVGTYIAGLKTYL